MKYSLLQYINFCGRRESVHNRIHMLCGKEFTSRTLADTAKISQPYASTILNGKIMPGLRTLLKICRALDVDLQDVYLDLKARNNGKKSRRRASA